MATARPPVQLAELLQFRPKWWWDPVPDWVLDHLNPAAVREIASIQLKTQIEMLKVQQNALEETMVAMRKAK